MKKVLSILALALCFVACQNDQSFEASNSDLVTAVINVTAPELSTRSDNDGNSGTNSAFGAIDFAEGDAEFWTKYDLRYIFEVRSGDENVLVHSETQTFDSYQGTTLEFRAVPNRSYNIYAYADFVLQGTQDDLHYNTSDLSKITVDNMNAMDEAYDAYFASENFVITTVFSEDITLKRFLSKVRVITTDLEWIDGYADPKTVEVMFYNHDLFESFNLYTGKIETVIAEPTYRYEIKNGYYNLGYDSREDAMTLFTTYIYATDEESTINFRMDTYDTMDRLIKSNDFSTEIPVRRNYLTTIVGDVLTTSANINIKIDDNFVDEYVEKVEDGEYDNNPVISEGLAAFNYTDEGSALAFGDEKGNEFVINIPDAMLVNNALVAGEYVYGDDFTIRDMKFVAPETRAAEALAAEVAEGTMVIEGDEENFKFTLDLVVYVEKDGKQEAYYPIFSYEGTIEKLALATPELEVEGRANGADYEVVAKWGAIAGAKNYKYNTGIGGGNTTDTAVEYTIKDFEYNKPYNFTVKAMPVNTTLYTESVAAEYTVEIKKLAAVENLVAEVAEGKVNLTWDAVENATGYTVTYGENATANVAECAYSFDAPEAEGEYTVSVLPTADGYAAPEATEATYTIEAAVEPTVLATPVVKAEVEGNVITLSWEAVENAATYSITVGTEMPVVTEELSYEFTGEYETEYTFAVVAIPADEVLYAASEAATVTETTEAEPVVEPESITVAEFLAMPEDGTTMYRLTGVITRMYRENNSNDTLYGNFYLKDATGEVLIYGLMDADGNKYWEASGAKIGDTITVETIRTSHNGTPQGKNSTFISLVPFVAEASEWGVVGDLTGWVAGADIVMYNTWKADNLFVAYNVEIASGAFKVRANNEWNDAKNYGLETAGKVYADSYYSVVTGGGSQNITPMEYGTYDVYFDLANERVALVTPGKEYANATDGGDPVVVIEGLTDHEWGLVGTFNGWDVANYAVATIEGEWAVVKNVTLENGDEFKFAADRAWALSYGSGSDANVGETYKTYDNGGNIKFVGEAGAYNIYFSMVDAKFYMEEYISPADVSEFVITFPGNPSKLTNSYTDSFLITLEESYEFEFTSFNNGGANNATTGWDAIRMGRKSNASVATVVTKSEIPYAVSAVKVNFTQVGSKMKSAKLIVASDADFANVVEEVEVAVAAGEVVYNITTSVSGYFYKLEYDMDADGKNGNYRIDKITYAK